MVTEQIEQLKKLQDVLIEKFDIEKKLAAIPKNIVIKKELLERMRERYQGNSETCEKKQQELIRLRLDLEQNENAREKLEGQIENVNTQREYEALEKEIRECSDKESAIREHQESLKTEITQLEEGLEQEQELTKTQEEELLKEEQEMNQQSRALRGELTTREDEERRLAESFNAEFLFKFQRIISAIGGRGIVPLASMVCSGCHMILPNHVVNEVRRENEILFCPHCSKVLYYEQKVEGDGGKVADADLVEEFEGALGSDISFDDIFNAEDQALEEEYRRRSAADAESADDSGEEEIDEGEDTEYSETYYEEGGGAEEIETEDSDSESYVTYDTDDHDGGSIG